VQLQQVMMNLITNSIDAMKDVDGNARARHQVTASRTRQLTVCVKRYGGGLPVQQADEIFYAFFTRSVMEPVWDCRISRSSLNRINGRLWAADNLRAREFSRHSAHHGRRHRLTPAACFTSAHVARESALGRARRG